MLKSSGRNRVSSLVAGPVFLINKFNVKSVEAEQFLKECEEDATKFKDQPGFVSAQLIRE